MSLKNDEKKQSKIVDSAIEEEYDEDLEELLDEEPIEEKPAEDIEENIDYNTNEEDNESFEKITDEAIKKNVSSCLLYGEIIKWFMFIIAFIYFIIGISSGEGILMWIIISLVFVLSGFISSMMIKWFGYVLKCLYDIKMK